MNKKLSFLFVLSQFLLIFFQHSIQAQTQNDTLAPRPIRWVIKLAPLALFDPDNTLQIGAERLLGQRYGLQAEAGYGWNNFSVYASNNPEDYQHREVWRGRVEWRTYIKRHGRMRRPRGTYWAYELLYKQVNNQEVQTIGRECQDGPCAYYQRTTNPVTKYVGAGHIKFGYQSAFDASPAARVLIDFYFGIGIRRRIVERPAQPTDSSYYWYEGGDLLGTNRTGAYTFPGLTTGIKVGYVF